MTSDLTSATSASGLCADVPPTQGFSGITASCIETDLGLRPACKLVSHMGVGVGPVTVVD